MIAKRVWLIILALVSINLQQRVMAEIKHELATFAGGCFWCMEQPVDEMDGVLEVTSGYSGGHTKNPTYEEVCSGRTGHTEVIQIKYDPSRINYKQLLDKFWK